MLTWVDWALIGVMLLSVIVGLWRGFVREVFSILIWALAGWLAFRFSGVAATWIEGWVTMPEAQVVIGFVGILVVTLVIGGLAVWLIAQLVNTTGLSGTDRMLGLLFGVVRGVIIIVLALLVSRFTPFPQNDWWQSSLLIPYFEQAADYSVRWLPEKLQKVLEEETDTIDSLESESADSVEQDLQSNQVVVGTQSVLFLN